jgi:Fungal Zn(2)-Cys(6) binuclear cluster domain
MVESISSVTRRKNGAFASCEPCRKSKVRCDHAQPVCERCRRRGQHLSCTYHLAPLTRKHEAHAVRENSEALSGSNAVLRSPTSHQDCLVLPSQAATSPDMNTELRGMTLSGVANDSGESSDRLRLHRSRENHNALYDERIATIAGTLRHLSDSDRIRVLVTTYYSASQASVIPSSLIIHALPSLSDTLSFIGFNEVTGAQNNKLRGLAETILVATSSRINLGSSLKPADFMALYTGKNLRLEFLGIVCSVAARACLLDQTRGDKRHTDLVQKLYQCSTNCLQLARELTPVNDMLVWLGQDRLMLVSLIEGESSKWIRR